MVVLELAAYYFTLLDPSLDVPLLSPEDRRRRDRRTPRLSIKYYSQSSFHYLFESGNDQALLNCCAVDHRVFRNLLDLFAPVFNRYTFDAKTGRIRELKLTRNGNSTGRPRSIDAKGALGLVLYWYRTRGSVARAHALAFGLTSTPMYLWLKFSRQVLLSVLQDHPLAVVTDPSPTEMKQYMAAIASKYPILKEEKVWAAADGLKLLLERSSDWGTQNKFYNGWTSNTYVSSVFVFAPDGRIRICTLNAPGSWHDSTLADYGVYDGMEKIYNEHGAKVVVDSAFRLSNKDYMIQSSQQDPMG